MIFVVSGPSGCGKSTLIGRVLRDVTDIRFSVSYTTREKRASEVEGREYHFVSKDTFDRMIRDHQFAEWARVHGHYYGTSKAEIEGRGGDIVLDIDVQGARRIKADFGKAAVFIFILPPVFEELRRRLQQRKTESPDLIAKRLADARREIRAYRQFDYVVINEKLETAIEELKSIILAARCRKESRKEKMKVILRSFADKDGSL